MKGTRLVGCSAAADERWTVVRRGCKNCRGARDNVSPFSLPPPPPWATARAVRRTRPLMATMLDKLAYGSQGRGDFCFCLGAYTTKAETKYAGEGWHAACRVWSCLPFARTVP